MKVLASLVTNKGFRRPIAVAAMIACASACSQYPFRPLEAPAGPVATDLEEVQKLKAAEYRDYTNTMSFEDSNQKLGNYYLHKGAEVHHVIDEMEKGQQVTPDAINKSLDTSDAEKYDNRPPVPLDDEIGNGY